MNDHTAAVQVVERLRQRAEAAEQRADRLAAVLREYGDLYGEGEVWHEWGCPGWQSADLGMCTPRCAESRAVLDDTYQPRAQMSPQRPRHPVADVLTDDMIRAALADSPSTSTLDERLLAAEKRGVLDDLADSPKEETR